mmetsp:Transcript_9093/g.12367  ORF Transcript_9093/g.12367 Transcript_9093/m.12367 type:complete len:89 (+) Transcript_9093:555-821(+)|eukprot:CAMPEP_0185598558 /NCGR_PEP_ID=MMETSP0434-20130131/82083_1 /TAXON_ID=626734 ORGANISM="Favella taraikaensis, Strain Fe Narragansett Bay" /NCGR_SAMPLE_ID=MMETSP0434 /ASSEMBLY_ACC=CAM_ASM_000379 /LENGTH=88 /DNA_ID=CAMNT_0028227593 /DNA_START=429 /DNA_END=695 /DNA_ORIENTATION=-
MIAEWTLRLSVVIATIFWLIVLHFGVGEQGNSGAPYNTFSIDGNNKVLAVVAYGQLMIILVFSYWRYSLKSVGVVNGELERETELRRS